MALTIRNTRDLVDFANFKLKLMVIGSPGLGKTTLAGTIADVVGPENVGVISAEPGDSGGLKSLARKGVDFVTPVNYQEAMAAAQGAVFRDKQAIIVDGADVLINNHTRKYAVSMPRGNKNDPGSVKRQAGVPEKDDYGTIGITGRDLIRAFLDTDKHTILTCNMRADRPGDDDLPGTILTYGPDVPGQSYRALVAMPDIVLYLMSRSVFRDPKDPKSRFSQRYFVTEPGNGTFFAKSRLNMGDRALSNVLPNEMLFDMETGEGTIGYMLNTIQEAYKKIV